MARVKWGITILLITILSVVVGCVQKETEIETVRIAHFPNITHAQAIVAREKEWFEKAMGEETDVEYLLFNAGSSEIEAFFSEQVDLGYIGPIPAINGHVKSRGDIIIISGASNLGARIVVANNAAIQKLKDLNNKRISVPQIGNTQHIALLHLLTQNGMADISHGGLVDLVVSNNAEVVEKMRNGELDAAFLPEPWATLLVSEGLGHNLEDESYGAFIESANTAIVIVHRDFLANHPEKVETFLKVHVEATELVESGSEEVVMLIDRFLSRETGQSLTENIIKESMSNIRFSVDPMKSSIMSYMSMFYDEGFIQELVEIDDLIRLERLNNVLKAMNLPSIQ